MGDVKSAIAAGKAVLGIEFGSTRIKAVLVDEDRKPIASGAHDWENRLGMDVYAGRYLDRSAGLLQEDGRRCHGTVRGESRKACRHWFQCYDAWIPGI